VENDLQLRGSYESSPPCMGLVTPYRVAKTHRIDPPSCRSFSTKEPLNIGHFSGK